MSLKRLFLLAMLAVGAVAQPAAAAPRIGFDASPRGRLVVSTPAYRLTLAKATGAILTLVDAKGVRLLKGQAGCAWSIGGAPCGSRARYRWDPRTATLTLTYDAATVTLVAGASSFDLRLTLANSGADPVRSVRFPADLIGENTRITAGYAPNYMPGVRLEPAFFSRVGQNVQTYPGRWAFADYLSFDAGGDHLALSTVNPAPSPIAPVELGFVHDEAGSCAGRGFCLRHAFATWIAPDASWTSPVVRVRIGGDVRATTLGYRSDNAIDAYPSLAAKLGPRLATLARSPLIKADLWKGLRPFSEWGPDLAKLPSPALIHPVAYQQGGHDSSDPDFLPPAAAWGSTADFRTAVELAHADGLLVMPYLDVSWWTLGSPTVQALANRAAVSVQDPSGKPVIEHYGNEDGLVASPYAPAVRARVEALMAQFRTEVPADCTFWDQLGARPWLRDFNPASPGPLAYDDGWLSITHSYAQSCLMVEDGWDRLAADTVGFHGSSLSVEREHGQPSQFYGAGNWEPYPLATWLVHDKVLTYMHDLYDGTLTADPEVLTWNMAFGNVLSYAWNNWDRSLDSPWLQVVGDVQHVLGPHYAGVPLGAYKRLSPTLTESTFGDLDVRANWSKAAVDSGDGYGIAPQGFLARTTGDGVVAGDFTGTFAGAALTPGAHVILVERDPYAVTVRQPLGADTTIAFAPPAAWLPGTGLRVSATATNGSPLATTTSARWNGSRVELDYAGTSVGRTVGSYRVGLG